MPKGLLLTKVDSHPTAHITEIPLSDSPNQGNLVVEVLYSSLNYKDGLAVTGKGKIIRGAYPFVPGIDLVGRVHATETTAFEPGDWVIGTGWGIGENHWGGYMTQQRLQADWLVPLPDTLSPQEAMSIGTAGFTAMLSVMALEEHGVTPSSGEIVVTGASGGVGSMSVALLAQAGYTVVASTGKKEAASYLKKLGASRLIGRDDLGQGPRHALDSARWAGAIDSVGGQTLAAILSQTARHGSVAACGLAASATLPTTVFPFILRGVNLLGIDSNTCPRPRRMTAWQRLADELPKPLIAEMTEMISLQDVPAWSERITNGAVTGRIVVDVQAG